MRLSRRALLLGASLLALSRANAGINNPGSASSQQPVIPGFNGGLKQVNTVSPFGPGCYLFMNFIKSASEIQYLSPPTDATWPKLPALELDADGYPTTLVAGTGGYFMNFTIPNATQYSQRWVLKWDGVGTVIPANFNATTNLTASNRLEFTNNDTSANWTSCAIFVQAFSNSPNHVTNLRMCRKIDEALMDAGQIVFPDHLTLMKSAKPGAIRSLGWGGGFDGTNTALVATWAQRRSRNFIQYGGGKYDSTKFPGATGTACTTTHSGTDYTLAYSGFTLTDKVLVHLIFDASAPHISTGTTVQLAWSTTNGVAININWTAHGLAVGNTIAFGDSTGTVPPSAINLATQQIFFVNNVVDANNFTFSATSGGSSVLATATTSGNLKIATIPRININSTGFVKMRDFQTPNPSSVGSVCGVTPAAGLSTIIYDATTGWFHISRSGPSLMCGGSPEVFVDYCAAIGANPWMTAPFLSQTIGAGVGVTDYMTSWVTYAKNTYPWMKPLVEPYNETWNPGLACLGTHYASTLSYALWQSQILAGGTLNRNIDNAYGKWVSDLGQAISAIYGNDRTKYSMLCMGQGTTFHDPASLVINDARLVSNLYVTVNGGQPAYKWTDRVGAANYIGSSEQDGFQEQVDAVNYYVTNNGNPSGQSAISESYTANVNSGVDTPYTTTYIQTLFTNIKAWALGQNGASVVPAPGASGNTVKGIVGYEGGWGPDVPVDHGDAVTNVSLVATPGITQANPCVVTIASGNSSTTVDGNANYSGNPGVVGQMINMQFVSGMTQLNNGGLLGATFTSGSASIACTQTLIANQAVMFVAGGQLPPAPFQLNIPYHVISTGLSGSAFQLSATKGGSAIVASASQASTVFTQGGWFVTVVSGLTITLDVDSTGFTAWTNASQAQIVWTGTGAYVGALRLSGILTNALGTANTQMYANHLALGGGGFTAEYPSNFIYFGNAGAWAVLNPNIYAPLTPQWNSIVAQQ